MDMNAYNHTKAHPLLEEFVKYCWDHPDQRFWQALTNWSGVSYLVSSDLPFCGHCDSQDTFYWETNKGKL